jgi:hypothetical protein
MAQMKSVLLFSVEIRVLLWGYFEWQTLEIHQVFF